MMSQLRFGAVLGLAIGCSVLSGCTRPWGGYANRTRPGTIYSTVPAGAIPVTPIPSSPVATDSNNGGAAPNGSADNGGIDGSNLSLQPAMRTSAWAPQYQNSYPSTFAVQPTTLKAQYASAGQTFDGRQIAWGGPPLYRTAALPHKSVMQPGSRADINLRQRAGHPGEMNSAALADGISATPQGDMKYRGGWTIRDLTYLNIYVGGKQAWNETDRKYIDWALASAMSDAYLNHVMMQYFNDEPITATFKKSYYLDGYRPQRVTQANVKELARLLYSKGAFAGLPLKSTVINFMLPSGVVLADPDAATQSGSGAIPYEKDSSSVAGLGGYHGSVHVGADTVYYTVGVYSERRENGMTNGIPVFDHPWQNVVATFYHELQEARTDPDVDDALSTGQERYLGWTSEIGEEVADSPVAEDGKDGKLGQVFIEVNLANGSGRVPIQLMYSNAVHGPEGPITRPYRGNSLPITAPIPIPGSDGQPSTPSNPAPQPPVAHHSELDIINGAWDRLPEAVKMQIIKLIQNADASGAPF